ncbi:hypothetical protein AAG906_021660 [Vitis piasezkii]
MFNRFAMASRSGSGGGGRGGGGGSGTFSRNLAWKYCSPLEGNQNGTIYSNNNTKKCISMPPEVKEEIRDMLHEKSKAKSNKIAHIEDIRDQLRGTMGARHTHVMDEDDDDDEGEEVYMYPADMNLDEQDAYREAVCASKAMEWE